MSFFDRAVAQAAGTLLATVAGSSLDDTFESAADTKVYNLADRHPSDDDSSDDAAVYEQDDMLGVAERDTAEEHYTPELGARELLRQQAIALFVVNRRYCVKQRALVPCGAAPPFDYARWQRAHTRAHERELDVDDYALYGAHAARFVAEVRARTAVLVRESARLRRVAALVAECGAPMRRLGALDARRERVWCVDEERVIVVAFEGGVAVEAPLFDALGTVLGVERTARDFAATALPASFGDDDVVSIVERLVGEPSTVARFSAELEAAFACLC